MRDIEALQANTEALTALEKRMQVVQGIMDEVANELGWLARNIQDVARGDTEVPWEEVRCMECDAEPVRGLAEALRIKWSNLMLHDGRFMGLCPCCSRDDEHPANAAEGTMKRGRTITVDAEQFARAMENVEVLSDSGDDLPVRCAECHTTADTPTSDAERKGWQIVGEQVDEYVGLCPECIERDSSTSDTLPAVPSTENTTLRGGTAAERPSPPEPRKPAAKRTKQQPLYMRMFTDRHMTALVRTVGYAGFPASEGHSA